MGTTLRLAQWSCPLNEKKDSIGPLTMPNVRVHKIIDSIDSLVDILIVHDTKRGSRMKLALSMYKKFMKTLRKKEDFTEEEIEQVQCEIDEFAQIWIPLFGKDGMTNSFHMLIYGHISYYLYKWKNLYRYKQQGWESLNNQFKHYYFHRTQKGGHTGNSDEKAEKMRPMALCIQRLIAWRSGIAETLQKKTKHFNINKFYYSI